MVCDICITQRYYVLCYCDMVCDICITQRYYVLCYCDIVCDICITQQYYVLCYCDMGTSFTMMTDNNVFSGVYDFLQITGLLEKLL